MNERKRILLALVVSLVIWAVFTWPLPRYVSRAIPYSSQLYNQELIHSMEPGDHLQYLYFMDLVKHMITGETPLMYNLYEFNTGNDAERFEPDPYYVPFSLLFTAIALVGNLALAWNLTGLICIWLSYWFTWKLVRRYTDHEWLAATAALLTFALPFRWATLMGGSPTGLAMLWPPIVMYGLDLAVRENRWSGGVMAGAAILFALWTDMHVFFFAALMAPCWCLFAFIMKTDFVWNQISSYRRLVLALLPVPLFIAGAMGLRHLHTMDQALVAEESRKWTEAALFSPHPVGLLNHAYGITGHVYIGYGVILMFVAGMVMMLMCLVARGKKAVHKREALAFILLTAGVVVLILLSLGTYGPQGGKVFDLARKYIPFYSMIRQSGKIYCMLPPMVAVASILVYRLGSWIPRRTLWTGAWMILLVWMVADGYRHVGVGLTWFNPRQGAYEAVARDAVEFELRPGAMVIPLWPGDSHFTSVYQIYALEYGIRMVNGYSPTVTQRYKNEIFHPFSSINQGVLVDQQLDDLLGRGIHYILLHQNMFPEQVSPFSVGFTIRNLLNNPRLEFLHQDERVWSFKILEKPTERPPVLTDWTTLFSSIRREVEFYTQRPFIRTNDVSAGNFSFVSCEGTNGFIQIPEIQVAKTPDLAWLIRARGQGVLAAVSGSMDQPVTEVSISTTSWEWHRVPIDQDSPIGPCGLRLESISGQTEVDVAVLVGGPWKRLAPGESFEFSAARFFHGGFMDAEHERVLLKKVDDPIAITFYGPKLPFDPGTYEVEFDYESSAAPGTDLGVVNLEQDDNTGRGIPLRVIAGQPAKGIVERTDNLPFKIVFIYSSLADMQINRVTFTRIK